MNEEPDSAAPDGLGPLATLSVATRFLTRLPVRAPDAPLAAAAAFFPVVGFAIGLAGGIAYWLALGVGLPPLAAALVALAATAALTGALHEDGLADMADGLAGGTAAESIRIMRDSQTGAYGVLALIFSIGLRAAALAALADPLRAPVVLIAAAALSRAVLPAIMRACPAASATGLGAAAGAPKGLDMWVGLGVAALAALVLLGPPAGLAAIAICGIAAWAVAALARSRIGGYTGDVLGAVQQICETAILLTAAAIL